MKKFLSVLCAFTLVFSVTACSSPTGSAEEEVSAEEESSDEGEASAESEEAADDAIEVVAEYSRSDTLGSSNYTYHYIIVKNNSDEDLTVSASSTAYDADGNELGTSVSGFISSLGPDCTSVMFETYNFDGTAADFDTAITSKPSTLFYSVTQDLTYTQSETEDSVVFDVTNNGSNAAESVEGFALFFKDGALIKHGLAFFTDSDNELKPGETISQEIYEFDDYDTVEFYLDGYGKN